MTNTPPIETNPPRKGTKLAKLVALLSRKRGVIIEKASEALAWQFHTTRATLTKLRKRGYNIERVDKVDKPSIYRIRQFEPAE